MATDIGDRLCGSIGIKRWGVTLGATAVSTYALDVIAAGAGVLLVASELLAGLDHQIVLVFLGGTYLLWIAGLRVNLAANWDLLERTGTSTNAPSKAAYDIVASRTGSVRARRTASAVGYVATEIAKETPYYAGAFGAALASEAISTADALIFLGGANLGAATYEYALAHLVRAYLRREGTRTHASFETDWVPQDYLDDYYRMVEPDERATIAFFVDALREVQGGEPVLLFGVGPTLHHVFLTAEKASEIHLGDYLPANLHEIERWLARDPGAHDWTPFVHYTLQCDGVRQPTPAQVAEREERTRAKISRLMQVDLRQPDPLLGATVPAYGTVISAYCADSATADRAAWALYTRRIAALVRPGGTLLLAALRRSRAYHVGGKSFPSADIDENSVHAVLRACGFASVEVVACALEDVAAKGYSSIVLARAGPALVAPVASFRRPLPAIPGYARTTADRTALPGP